MKTAKFLYRAYGLTIVSDFYLPGMVEGHGVPDIVIRYGTVPIFLEDAIITTILFQVALERFSITLDGVARYLVISGREIVVEPCVTANDADVQVFLLGTVFGALLQMRGGFVLHGAAVAIHGQGIILSGVSGAGKSTLAGALAQKGYEFLADDVCAVSLSKEGQPQIIPGYPRITLWADAVEELGEDVRLLHRVRNNLEKYELSMHEIFSSTAVPLRYCCQLSCTNTEKVQVVDITDIEKMETIEKNSYRYWFLSGHGGTLHVKQCGEMASAIDIFHIARPMDGFWLDELVDQLEERLRL